MPKAPPRQASMPPHAIMQQAAEWFALLRSGEATGADRRRWQQWLADSQEHRRAWGYVDAMSQGMAALQASADPRGLSDRMLAVNRRQATRRTLLGLAVLAGTGTLGWAAWRHGGLPDAMLAWASDHHTAIGEVREVALPDSGSAWLNTASAINVDYGHDLRRVELLRGEVLVATQSDAAGRPFVVDTVHGRMRALGTRFSVWLQEAQTHMAVFEGAVQLQPAGPGGGQPVVGAGRHAVFDAAGLRSMGGGDTAVPSWTSGVLQAHDITLQELVRQLRRYYRGHIGVADEVAPLRVFGSFPLQRVDQSLRSLESALPVRVSQTLPWWISVQPL